MTKYLPKQKLFSSTYKVYFSNTDAAGVVHHSQYINWLEASRIDFLDHIDYPYSDLQKEKKGFSPVHIDIQYKKPLRFGDSVTVRTCVTKIGNASITFYSELFSESGLVCAATQKLASLDEETWRLSKVPNDFLEKLRTFEENQSNL